MCDKLTSSMPFINPFGSLSMSMFGFLFIFKKRSSISRTNTSLSPAAVRPLLDSSRVTSLAAWQLFYIDSQLFWALTCGNPRVASTSRVRSRAKMKVAVQSRRAKIKRVFLTLDLSVVVAYGGHSVWSNDNHVLFERQRGQEPSRWLLGKQMMAESMGESFFLGRGVVGVKSKENQRNQTFFLS